MASSTYCAALSAACTVTDRQSVAVSSVWQYIPVVSEVHVKTSEEFHMIT